MRRLAIVMAAALAAAPAAMVVAGTAGAQAAATVAVVPGIADPGGVVRVSNGPGSLCPPPSGTRNPSASVDLFTLGSATPVNRVPYQGVVTPSGLWSVEVRLAPDLPPGTYRVQAGCYSDSGLNSGFGPSYEAGRLELRLQQPGQPSTPRRGRPGDSVQVSSGEARCTPPAGSPSPRVRVSLLDAGGATRAEAEGPVDVATGRWTVGLRVPDITPQGGEISAVCLARVAAPAPYARYRGTAFAIEGQPAAPTIPAPSPPPPTVAPGTPNTAPVTTATTAPVPTLPATPIAVAIVAEPTYTG